MYDNILDVPMNAVKIQKTHSTQLSIHYKYTHISVTAISIIYSIWIWKVSFLFFSNQ